MMASENVAATAVEDDEESTRWKAKITGQIDLGQNRPNKYDYIILSSS